MNIKEKMGTRGRAVVKMTLWAGMLTWMLFYLALGIVIARKLASYGPELYGGGAMGDILQWVAPIWLVFTVLLTIVLTARFVVKKLGKKER